eukprot:1159094-Pelagomonas_calceolata.AAC.14
MTATQKSLCPPDSPFLSQGLVSDKALWQGVKQAGKTMFQTQAHKICIVLTMQLCYYKTNNKETG